MTAITSRRNRLSEYLTSDAPIILDGALATYLEYLGADISGALWSANIILQKPQLIRQTHLDYFRAGAQVAITASYQASIPGLVKHLGVSVPDAKAIVKKSVRLAKEARDAYVVEAMNKQSRESETSLVAFEASLRNQLFIAGSVGPYGAFLANGSEYTGDYALSKEDIKNFHRGRIEALIEADVDVLACETMPSKAEVEALLELLATEFNDVEVWISFTLRDGHHISDGTSIIEIAVLFDDFKHVVALGFNCVPDGVGLEALTVLGSLKKKSAMLIYPNSGEHWDAQARKWQGERIKGPDLTTKTLNWRNAGARLIGGCCQTRPEDITIMCKAVAMS